MKMRLPLALAIHSLFVMGCAGKPAAQPAATTYIGADGKPLAAAPTRTDGTLDAEKLADAKRAGYSLVNTNGELLYCRTDVKVGSRIPRNTDTVCLTAQEMIEMHDRTQQNLQQFMPHHLCGGPPPAPSC